MRLEQKQTRGERSSFPACTCVSRVHLTGVFAVFVCAKMVNSEAARGLRWQITPVLQVKKVDYIFNLINRLSQIGFNLYSWKQKTIDTNLTLMEIKKFLFSHEAYLLGMK